MKKLAWCVLIAAVVGVAGCSAPTPQEETAAEPEATSAGAAGDEAVVEEGFESGETGSLEQGDAAPKDETAPDEGR